MSKTSDPECLHCELAPQVIAYIDRHGGDAKARGLAVGNLAQLIGEIIAVDVLAMMPARAPMVMNISELMAAIHKMITSTTVGQIDAALKEQGKEGVH